MVVPAWVTYTVAAVLGILIGGFILTRTNWYRIRKYAIDVKRIFDKHKVEEKAQAVQALGPNPNPVLAKKPLRELVSAYEAMLADLQKVKVPPKAREVHEETVAMHRESCNLYRLAMTGGFRQKALLEKQKKLQQMERSLTAKMEQLYGPMPKPGEKPRFKWPWQK